MKVVDTRIPDVKIIEPQVFRDERGFFMETWNQEKFEKLVVNKPIKFVLRGLHYQIENTQGKLVRVIKGEVYDVAVDMREKSETFGQWVGLLLSEDNKRQLWIPEGFAHGFYVTSEQAEFAYKCTDYYNPNSEVSIRWDDEKLNIGWPLISSKDPVLTKKDKAGLEFIKAPYF